MELASVIDPIKRELESFEERYKAILTSDSSIIFEITEHLLRKRGKRLRPVAVLLSSGACGGDFNLAIEAAIAIELIHTATLLHDDVVDQSDYRRGQSSVNYKWNNTVSVLMGDYLFAKAFKTLVGSGSSQLHSAVSWGTEQVSIGQLDEIREIGNLKLSEDQYFNIISDKTASLFAAACRAGGLTSQNTSGNEEGLEEYGRALGIAFQIADDLLDYVGQTEQVGKEVGKDLLEGRVTLPLIYSLSQAPPLERDKTVKFLQNGYSPEGFPSVVEFVTKWGGIDYCLSRAKNFGEKACSHLGHIPEGSYKESLVNLVQFAVSRQK